MKHQSILTLNKYSTLWALSLGFMTLPEALQAQELAIQLHPTITVTGEAGSTYVIESKTSVEDDFWLTRGVVELTSPQAQWFDSVPTDAPRRIYRAVEVTKPEGVKPVENMVWIPAGRFTMGSPESERGRGGNEGPQTRVTLTQSFWMGKYEVTQRQYQELMGSNPSHFKGDLDRPVERVAWVDAEPYCQKLTEQERAAGHLPEGYVYRLPTEAEWEYACRAGTTTRFSFGEALECGDDGYYLCGLMDQYMWWGGNNEPESTKRVGQKRPNAWGLYDMPGNVWELCLDWWSANLPGGSVTDPQGPDSGWSRVIRGGNWHSSARGCRSAFRYRHNPDSWAHFHVGFRLVLAPGQPGQ